MIISECTASPSVVVKCLPWAASQSVQLVRSQLIADSDAHTVARASRNLEEEPRGKSKEMIAASCTATSGAVLVALLSKVLHELCIKWPSFSQDMPVLNYDL